MANVYYLRRGSKVELFSVERVCLYIIMIDDDWLVMMMMMIIIIIIKRLTLL